MTIDEKVGKTLVELGVTDSVRICTLFDEARAAIQEERRLLLSHFTDPQFDEFAKNLHDRWLARKNGLVTRMGERWLNDSPKELKPNVGQEFNKFKSEAKETLALERGKQRRTKALAMWEEGEANERLLAGRQRREKALAMWEEGEAEADLTLPGLRRPLGSIHPVIRVQREIEEIFLGLGFKIETGPEIESVYYNFDALNIPESHPSRDDFDTIYIDSKTLLRTHTSPVQIRAMEKFVRAGAHGGLYIITPGKCYRHDNPDATHTPMFHQVEGLAIDTDITFADLKGTLDYFAKKFFGEKTRTSFNPSFFPFTEPSGEVAVSCYVCDGVGCRTCKDSGWIEVMGCGMVHPQVLKYGGIDPERYSGWAFGLGIDRFAAARYGINDIQLFFQGDVRFLEQFS